jgi:hypothetical protein
MPYYIQFVYQLGLQTPPSLAENVWWPDRALTDEQVAALVSKNQPAQDFLPNEYHLEGAHNQARTSGGGIGITIDQIATVCWRSKHLLECVFGFPEEH